MLLAASLCRIPGLSEPIPEGGRDGLLGNDTYRFEIRVSFKHQRCIESSLRIYSH